MLSGLQAPQSGKPSEGQTQGNQAPAPQSPEQQQALSLQEVIARDVLEPLQVGISTRNSKQIFSVFDPQATTNLPEVRDQFRSLLQNYSDLQFRYKLLQLTSEKDRASAICEFDMDATPLDQTLLPVRRSTQMRLQLTHTPQGWKVISFTPADFFAQ